MGKDVQILQPDPTCKQCHGTGEISELMDYYGMAPAYETLWCSCIEAQMDDSDRPIELDLSRLEL